MQLSADCVNIALDDLAVEGTCLDERVYHWGP